MRAMTIAQASEVLPLSEKTLYRLAIKGESPFRKIGGRWMALEDDLIEWVRSGTPRTRIADADPMPKSKGSDQPSMIELVNLR